MNITGIMTRNILFLLLSVLLSTTSKSQSKTTITNKRFSEKTLTIQPQKKKFRKNEALINEIKKIESEKKLTRQQKKQKIKSLIQQKKLSRKSAVVRKNNKANK